MIHLRTMDLEKIDMMKHYGLLMSLQRDEKVYGYISKNLIAWLEKHQAVSEDKIEVNKSYVICKDNHYIGVIGSLNFSNAGILEIWCAIQNNLRGKGYGEKILAEITPYLIEHVDGLNDIELKINRNNLSSKRVAEKNGYNLVKDNMGLNHDIDVYRYFERKR